MSSERSDAQQRMLPRYDNAPELQRHGVQVAESIRALPAVMVLLLSTWCCVLTGCHHGVYTARTLPAELMAPPVVDVHDLDISRMGGSTFRNEAIFPGDTLQVAIVTGADEEHVEPWELRVGDGGSADVPLVGTVHVAGSTLPEAENTIRLASIQRRVYRKPTVRVTVGKRRVNRVTVAGAVNMPGTYELPAASSHLTAALLAAGGLSENADRIVEIHQRTTESGRFVNRLTSRNPNAAAGNIFGDAGFTTVAIDLVEEVGGPTRTIHLGDGAIVTVNRQPDRVVHLIGLTGNRALQLPPNRNVRVLDALAQAGGLHYSYWIANKVKVIRTVPHSDETVSINVSIQDAKQNGSGNILLQSGDIVSVEENFLTFTLGTLGQLIGIGTTAATGAAAGLAP